jgi:hypothetical protein
MKISLITISPSGVEWKTLRDGRVLSGRIGPSVPRDKNGDFMYMDSPRGSSVASYGLPFSDLPEFFNAAPRLEKFFVALARKELTPRWLGLRIRNPILAVHLVGYSRPIHLGEKTSLKDWVFRWGARSVVLCDWPTPYPDSIVHEILTGDVFNKQTPDRALHPTGPAAGADAQRSAK